jgi:uncharacterized protein (TIGR03545 family)
MRWKFVVPAIVLASLIVIFNVFFLDALIKRSMVSTGEKIFGARVEVGKVKTRFRNLSIDISGLKVADNKDPWKNLFEVGGIRFGLEPLPLFSKKFIIDEMGIEGVRWGTKRTTSGALPKRKQEKLAKERAKENKNSFTAKLLNSISNKAKTEFAALPAVQTAKDAEKLLNNLTIENAIDVAGLQSIKEIEGMQGSLQGKYTQYQDALKNLNIDNKVNQATQAVNEAANIRVQTVQDIAPAKAKIDNLNRQREDLQKTMQEVQSLQARLKSDYGDQQTLLKKIGEMKDRDITLIASRLKLPSFSMGNVSASLFGPLWVSRVESVVYYMHLAQKYMPPRKKEDKKIVKQRLKGMDVSFPTAATPPDFLIRRIVLSGSTGGVGKTVAGIDFKGTVTDITSDPVLWGRPVRMEISGAQGAKKLQLNGVFDHTQPVGEDILRLSYDGMDMKEFGLPKSDFVPSFDNGQAAVTSSFALKGNTLDCGLGLAVSGLTFSPANTSMNSEVQATLAELWKGISTVQVNAKLTGTPDQMLTSVSSNLDQLLAERLKNLYGAKLTEVNNRIRAEVDRITKEKEQELMKQYTAQKDALMKVFDEQQKTLQDKIGSVQGQISAKQKEITGQAETEKNKATEELKKQAQDKFKNLFK